MMEDIFPKALTKNFSALCKKDQKKLLNSRVFVVGCGGLGGYVLEILARMGVGSLIFADGDVFEETNLNRQLFSTTENLGKNKAICAKERIRQIAPFCRTYAIDRFLNLNEIEFYIKEVDVVIDAIGGIRFKADLIATAQKQKIPIITGAIAGFEGFISCVLPDSNPPLDFFQGSDMEGAENILGSPAPSVSLIATLQAFEAISYICWQRFHLVNKVFYVSLKDFSFTTLSLC